MSRKPPHIVSLDNRKTRGVVIHDYEEDSRGRRVKSKPYQKPPTKTSHIVKADNRLSAPIMEDIDPELVPADEDFEGVELDLTDFPLHGEESDLPARKVSGVWDKS